MARLVPEEGRSICTISMVLALLCAVGCATASGKEQARTFALGSPVVEPTPRQKEPAAKPRSASFCDLNPEACPEGARPDVSKFSSKAECKASCWTSYEHNKAHCEELRHDDAAYRRCMIAAGLLLAGCLSACEAVP